MRFVQRPETPPEASSAPEFQRMRQAYLEFLSLDPRRRAQTTPPDRHLPTRDTGLDEALRQLFHGKCAFCERRVEVSAYRFRPTSDALPIDPVVGRFAYGWLADAWQNLYPICRDCRPSPLNNFPVAGARLPLPTAEAYQPYVTAGNGRWPYPVYSASWAGDVVETPILLDPCIDNDLASHLSAGPDAHWIASGSRGTETIRHFQLNRPALVAARLAAVAHLEQQIAEAVAALIANPAANLAVLLPAELEHAGFLQGFARSQAASLNAPVGQQIDSAGMAGDAAPEAPPVYSEPPTLTRIRIRSFKAIEDLTIDMPVQADPKGPTPALLILGENAAGKSSILEATALTLASAAARKEVVSDPAALLLDPVILGGTPGQRSPGLVRLTLRHKDGKTVTRTLRLNPGGWSGPQEALKDLPVFAYGAYRHYLKDFRDWAPDRGIVSLFRSDNLLSNPEKWLLRMSEDQFNEVIGILRDIIGTGGSFEWIERANGRCMVVTYPEGEGGPMTQTPLSSVSSGFRTILALTCDVMRWLTDPERPWKFATLGQASGIILIDEVEAHLHPRWKLQIMSGLRRALPKMTFIVTTHDPLCLRGMRNDEVMVLQRVPKARGTDGLPVKVEQLTSLPDITNLTVEQLLTSDFFSVFDPDDSQRGQRLAELTDKIAAADADSPEGRKLREELAEMIAPDVAKSLPVGRSEVAMLVQEAVAEYLAKRRRTTWDRRQKLRDETRLRIVRILSEGRDIPVTRTVT
jgi:AAA domain, putative AbiEii toxin, Type IV TA system/AAA domain